MICLRWWELVLSLWVGDWIAKRIHAEERGRQAGRALARWALRHRPGGANP